MLMNLLAVVGRCGAGHSGRGKPFGLSLPKACGTIAGRMFAMTATLTAAKHDVALPAPAERPEADVVIYDGHCKFCTGQVKNLARWDTRGRLAFLSLHDAEVPRRFPELTHDQLMEQMYVVDQKGNRYGGAAAF